MGRHNNAVVHPLAFSAHRDDASLPQIRQMPRDFRLRATQDFHEVADANLLISYEVEEPEAGIVPQGLKKLLHVEWLRSACHRECIRLDEYESKEYIHIGEYVFGGGYMAKQILESVRSKYGAVAQSTLSNEDDGVRAVAEAFGYSTEELTSIPAEANMGLSCGNPTATAHIRPGEVVVDLGSGGGLDVFLASKMVGPQGRAIGIDMTPAMIERARANAMVGGYTNVEFYQSTIDNIPLPDASVDCVISNCVLNLAPDKPAVFHEIARVLKPGGRVAVSDIALKGELPEAVARSMAAYVGCIAGAIKIEDYRAGLLAAGFEHVEIVDSGADLNAYTKVENQSGCCSAAMDGDSCCASTRDTTASLHTELAELLIKHDINAAAASVKVYAIKPKNAASPPCCGPSCCA
jgi:arsenite methyltransferase